MSRDRRSLKNLLVNPERQIHYGSLFLAIAIAVHALACSLMYLLYNAWQAKAIEAGASSMYMLMFGMVVMYGLLFGFAFVLGLVISHRIYGPLVNFERHFQQLIAGDFSGRIVLRKNDDTKLKQLADTVNELTVRMAAGKRS